jgi:hypothetical protein
VRQPQCWCPCGAHLPNDLDQPRNEIGALDVLVGLVEDHKLVELPPVVGRLSEHLQENNEESASSFSTSSSRNDDEPAAGSPTTTLYSAIRAVHQLCLLTGVRWISRYLVQTIGPVVAHRDRSLRSTNSVAIGGIADVPRASRA